MNDMPSIVRPKVMRIAVRLLWTDFVIGVVGTCISLSSTFHDPRYSHAIKDATESGSIFMRIMIWIPMILFMLVEFSVNATLNYKIMQGRKWARLTGLVLFVLTSAYNAYMTYAYPKIMLTPKYFFIDVCFVLAVIAYWLVFTKSANSWFNAVSERLKDISLQINTLNREMDGERAP